MEQPNFAVEAKEVVIEMMNGNTLRLQRQDPYGLIKLSLARGALPEKYQGDYTDWRAARKAAEHYLDDRNIVEGKAPERPVIQYKNVPKTKE